jgi:hypothetical protein
MPLDDHVTTAAPFAGQPAAPSLPQKGKVKGKPGTKDEIIINPTDKEIVQEAKEKHVVFAFGRMNPPTTGHQALVNKMHDVAKDHNATHVLVASHSQDAKKNPLGGEAKIKHLKRYFPNTNIKLASKEHPTFLQHTAELHKSGATHLHMIAGSDRVDEYKQKLHQYNGEGEGKLFNFKHIEVHSSGDRDPDAEGTAGMSASKMREHAKAGEFSKFKKGIPSHVSSEHAKELYNDTRSGMKLSEELELSERVVSLQQRRVRANLMKRLKSRLSRARDISRHRLGTEKQLERRAARVAKQNIRRRFTGSRGMQYQKLAPSDKVSVDTTIDPKVKNIRNIVTRIMPRIRQADVKRLQAVRTGKAYRTGSFPQFNSVELDIEKFNKLYEMVFGEAKNTDMIGNMKASDYNDAVEKLKQHVKNIQDKKPKTVYDDKTRRYKVVYEEVSSRPANLNESFGSFYTARDLGIVAEGGFAMHPSVQVYLDEDAASHLRQAAVAERTGKSARAGLHRKIASALQRGDMTAAKATAVELERLKD